MNQSDKKIFDTVEAVVEDIIAEMPLDDMVRVANLQGIRNCGRHKRYA